MRRAVEYGIGLVLVLSSLILGGMREADDDAEPRQLPPASD
jgi:hypothetical protein